MVESLKDVVSGLLSGNRGARNRSGANYTISYSGCAIRGSVVSERCSLGSIEVVGGHRGPIRGRSLEHALCVSLFCGL